MLLVTLVSVHLLSQGPGDRLPDTRPKRARIDQTVTLFVAFQTSDGRLYSDAPRVDLGAGPRAAEPWRGKGLEVGWFKVEPTGQAYDNEKGGFHWDPVDYAETGWPENRELTCAAFPQAVTLSRVADAHPTRLPDHQGLGTMHYKVRLTLEGKTLATPGMESRFRGGLSEEVTRVSFRRSDDFLGYLTENFGTPYIWASAGEGAMHQTERNVGGDCADFIAYGLRRAGLSIPYGSTYDVPRWGGGRPIARVARRGEDGVFLDDKDEPISGIKPGDLLLFHRHVAAFLEHRLPSGVLDASDRIIHTAWAAPDEQTFDEAATWTQPPFEVYRAPSAR